MIGSVIGDDLRRTVLAANEQLRAMSAAEAAQSRQPGKWSPPADVLSAPRSDHNLDRIAWQVVPADQPVTLEYFMRDYVDHLKHHLRQIDPALASTSAAQQRL